MPEVGKKGCGGREVRTAVTEDPWVDFQVLSKQMPADANTN